MLATISGQLGLDCHVALHPLNGGHLPAKEALAPPLSHFDGRLGKRRLLEALRAQVLVAGDDGLARKLARLGQLEKHAAGAVLITQGAQDNNDLFFIAIGSVSVRVNGREIAVRSARSHVGEMALVDNLSRRSATVITLEPTVTLRVSEHVFSRLAKDEPELWRRVAVEVANRLRERSRYIRE